MAVASEPLRHGRANPGPTLDGAELPVNVPALFEVIEAGSDFEKRSSKDLCRHGSREHVLSREVEIRGSRRIPGDPVRVGEVVLVVGTAASADREPHRDRVSPAAGSTDTLLVVEP